MPPNIPLRLRELHPELTAIRRDIHAHPEMGLEEKRTAALVAACLRDWGLDVAEGVGHTGVVGTLRGRRPGQGAIGLRADMDALAIQEATGLPYASTQPGVMHACGHDGHTTMLLGAARFLAEAPDFAGTVHFIFQPAEEGRGGADAMLADGLFDRFPCDAVYGMHTGAGRPLGLFELRKGPFMASAGMWKVVFTGNGGHGGSKPHLASDLSIALAHFVLGLQTIVGRNVPPGETAVLSVGHIAGGAADSPNVMPAEMVVSGTVRAFTRPTREVLERRLHELAQGFAALQGCAATVEVRWITAPLVNHPEQTDAATSAARAVAGAAAVDADAEPTTGGEDFAAMLEARPGAFLFVGNGTSPGVHTPMFDFNDELLPIGAAYWVRLVQQELATGS